jgi:uncharacterized SAM-binding protein YcdF (DUF218 family)
MYLFKKTVAFFLFPYRIGLFLILAGIIFLWFTRKQKAGKWFVSVGLGLLVIVSVGIVSDPLLGRIENRYPALELNPHHADANWVVVLGGGAYASEKLSTLDRLSFESLTRLTEGIRILRQLKLPAKIILSGGNPSGKVIEAHEMKTAAVALGVETGRMVIEDQSVDTKDQVRFVRDMVGEEKFILVTSARHMPRAFALFSKQGMNPVPAPVGMIVKEEGGFGPAALLPGAGRLMRTELAVYEYLGIAWTWLRGQV